LDCEIDGPGPEVDGPGREVDACKGDPVTTGPLVGRPPEVRVLAGTTPGSSGLVPGVALGSGPFDTER
jgi:hypothetical protein